MSRYTSSAMSRNDTARRRADVGKWVTSARKRTKVTGGGGLILPDYFVSHEAATITSNGVDYDVYFGWVLDAAAIQARSDYASLLLGVESGKYNVHVVYLNPVDGFVRRYELSGFVFGGGDTVSLGTPSATANLVGVGAGPGQGTVNMQYRLEIVGFATDMTLARTANEGEYSHTITLTAYNPPDITNPLPTPQYLYGSSYDASDEGIHDKKITVTVANGEFPAPDYSGHIYNVYLDLETHDGTTWGGSDFATIQSVVADTNLSTLAGTFANLFSTDVTPYTPRRVRYRVTTLSGAYTKTGPWSATFCYPPKLLPDRSAETGIAFGLDYTTLRFAQHGLRLTSFALLGSDIATSTVRLKTRYRSTTQATPTPSQSFVVGSENVVQADFSSSSLTDYYGNQFVASGGYSFDGTHFVANANTALQFTPTDWGIFDGLGGNWSNKIVMTIPSGGSLDRYISKFVNPDNWLGFNVHFYETGIQFKGFARNDDNTMRLLFYMVYDVVNEPGGSAAFFDNEHEYEFVYQALVDDPSGAYGTAKIILDNVVKITINLSDPSFSAATQANGVYLPDAGYYEARFGVGNTKVRSFTIGPYATTSSDHIDRLDTPSSIFTPSTVATTGPDQLAPGDVIANPGSSTLFSIVPSLWPALLGGDDFGLTVTYPTADARARVGFRNEWLDFTSAKQTSLTVPLVTAFNMDWQLNDDDKTVWDMSVESFVAHDWPDGNFADFRFGVQPYRHTSVDGDFIDHFSRDKPLQLGKFTDKNQVFADNGITEYLVTPPRNYRWSYQYLRMNNDNYYYQGQLNRIIYTAPEVNSVTFDTVALAGTGAGYIVRATAFTGFDFGFVAGEKNTYDVDIYISVYGNATTPAECEVGPISVSLSTASFPVPLYEFDRTATTPYKWGDSYVTNGDAQTHKLFVLTSYTPSPANGETVESMPKIGPLHTAIVSGVAVDAIPPPPGVLESYASSVLPSLNGAYSPRRLFSAYTGPTMMIRRDTDNKQGEVYVDASGNISWVYDPIALGISTFADWVAGATVIEPVILYDQSGNGNDAILTAATARSATNFMHFDSTEMTLTAGDATGAGDHYYTLPDDTVPIGDLSYTLLAHHGNLYHVYSQFVSGGQTSVRMFNGLSRGSSTQYVNNWWADDVSGGPVVTTGAVVAAAYDHVSSQRKIWTPATGNGTWVNAANDRVAGARMCYIGRQNTLYMRCQLKTILIANAVLSDADISGIQVALEA